MRITDHRYQGEMSKFNLAVRMIGHEARTGTIRLCTGFSEDRIRKIYSTYFRDGNVMTVRRRRGKSPSQIHMFLSSADRQAEATILACLFICRDVLQLDTSKGLASRTNIDPSTLGERICDAYETYRLLHPQPQICFERAWGLYNALAGSQELFYATCDECHGPYIQDRFALDYAHCPFCDIRQN